MALILSLLLFTVPADIPLTHFQAGTFYLPTIFELQEELQRTGYDIGTDGVDGILGGNTMQAWNRYICDKEASKHNYNRGNKR